MALLDDLQTMYGQNAGQDDTLLRMLAGSSAPSPSALAGSQYEQLPMNGGTPNGGIAPIETQMPAGGVEQLNAPQRETTDLDIMEMYSKMVNDNAAARQAQGGSGAPAGMHAQSVTQKSESGGVPTDVQAQGVAVRGAADIADAEVARQRIEKDAQAAREQADQIRAEVAAETQKRQVEENELAQKQQRLRGQQADLAKQADEPINAHRYFDNMSVFTKGTAILSAALYGYLNPKASGPAPVVESLMQMAQEDTRAQMANNLQARSNRDSVMAQYEREYGDTTLVAKRLEADKLLTLAKEAKAQGLDAKSAQARANAEDIAKQLQNRVGVLHQQIQEATYGKPVQTTTTYQPNAPKGAGMAAAYDRAAKVYQSLAAAGVSPEERVKALAAMKLPTEGFGGKTAGEKEDEQKRADAEAKKTELTPDQKSKAALAADGLAEMTLGLRELDDHLHISRAQGTGKVVTTPGGIEEAMSPNTNTATGILRALPWKAGEGAADMVEQGAPTQAAKTLKRISDKIVFGKAKADGQGALSGPDLPRYRAMLPTNDSQALLTASEELYRERRQKWRNLVAVLGEQRAIEEMKKRHIDPAELDAIQEPE